VKIYVGNLSYEAAEDSLRDLFSKYGEIEEVAIITDRQTGKARGFAFVTMPDAGQGQAAITALNGSQFDGRALVVNEARPKAGGGGGGGRDRR
jgi:cold-inducible RNA-binding protein